MCRFEYILGVLILTGDKTAFVNTFGPTIWVVSLCLFLKFNLLADVEPIPDSIL